MAGRWQADPAALAALKTGKRPADKAFGRCLGDFLNVEFPNFLWPAEFALLEACANGDECRFNNQPALPQNPALSAFEYRKAALRHAVAANFIRAGFLRFLALGGDANAPVHERGIQLYNAWVEGTLDLRSGRCASRIALTSCVLCGEWLMQDAKLDVLVLTGSLLDALRANRAKISGAIWLDQNFIADGEVQLFGTEIGGRLDCSTGYFVRGIAAPGAMIGGDLTLSDVTAAQTVSLMNATLGGSLICERASFSAAAARPALDLSRAKVKGNVVFAGAAAIAAGWSRAVSGLAVDGQSMKVEGAVFFGPGFLAKGEVCFNGAEVAKDLNFSDSSFRNKAGFAIRADGAKISGAMRFQTSQHLPGEPFHYFRSSGSVSLAAAECGELNCGGGQFINPNHEARNTFAALSAVTIKVAGTVYLGYILNTAFRCYGTVNFNSARIGLNLECLGGQFIAPGKVALNCEASKIDGGVFLGVGLQQFKSDTLAEENRKKALLAFKSNGKVNFQAATIGLSLICTLGRFCNDSVSPRTPLRKPGPYDADAALDLTTARVCDTLYLGREFPGDIAPVIEGSVDLTGAMVRVLVDAGLTDGDEPGLRKTVSGKDIGGHAIDLGCRLILDQFVYERLKGDNACDSDIRTAWLHRQPAADLTAAFKPQPFEQLVTVLRAMGHDDDADDIALLKRRYARRAAWSRSRIGKYSAKAGWARAARSRAARAWNGAATRRLRTSGLWLWKLLTIPWEFGTSVFDAAFLDWFTGYGYQLGRAVVLLLVLVFGFGAFYANAFQRGAIAPVDKDVRIAASVLPGAQLAASVSGDQDDGKSVWECRAWSVTKCPGIADQAVPLFNPWLYSADVMVPIVTLGQRAAWAPVPDATDNRSSIGPLPAPTNLVYDVQLIETVLGWVEGFLLVSFVTGLISKE
jgi:hypothetical protein